MEFHHSAQTFSSEGYHPLPVSPELRFRNNDVVGDPIKCCTASSVGDIGLEVHDDLFSMYMDLEKLEEQQVNVCLDNNFHVNGGGFVVESGDDASGGRRRKRRKDDKYVKNQIRRTLRCNKEKNCPADDRVLEPRKAILEEELAKLWVINPKRAQRILSNRQSAARSKEKKARYTIDLEKKIRVLHAKMLELTSQLAIKQKEIADLAAEKSELKLQLQNMEHQVKQYDAQNEELQLEIENLKTAIGEMEYSEWLNTRMNNIPHSPSSSHLALPQIPTSPMSQQKLLPLIQSSQLSMSTQYLHTAS